MCKSQEAGREGLRESVTTTTAAADTHHSRASSISRVSRRRERKRRRRLLWPQQGILKTSGEGRSALVSSMVAGWRR